MSVLVTVDYTLSPEEEALYLLRKNWVSTLNLGSSERADHHAMSWEELNKRRDEVFDLLQKSRDAIEEAKIRSEYRLLKSYYIEFTESVRSHPQSPYNTVPVPMAMTDTSPASVDTVMMDVI